MKVRYIGFGGDCIEYPCYEDENGNLYFDLNDGRNGLDLYTGAYRSSGCEVIYGEPDVHITETVECNEPFIRHARERDYMMLGRLQRDCEYFLGFGYGCEKHLYYKNVNKHCDEMEKLWNSFSEADKPKWLTLEQIKKYRKQMSERRSA